MAALKDIARDNADELRDGIAWVIVYRTGQTIRNTRADQDRQPQKPKGAQT